MRIEILAFSIALTAAAQDAPPADPVEVAIVELEGLASAEPPIFGLDTRLRAVELLKQKRPVQARALLDRTVPVIKALRDPDSQARFLVRAIREMASLDAGEAERLTKLIPQTARGERDHVGDAFDAIAERLTGDSGELIGRALDAGVFRMDKAADRLRRLADSDPAAAASLFARMMAAFPEKPVPEDADYLSNLSRFMLRQNSPAALEGFARALGAGWIPDKEMASALQARDADFYKQHRRQIERPRVKEERVKEPPSIFDGLPFNPAELSFSEALTAARRITEPAHRIGALIEISRREDLTGTQRGVAAVEALAAASKLDATNPNRLFIFSMLGRDFIERGDQRNAERSAALLADSFNQLCGCEKGSCESLEGREDCAEMIGDYADYLEDAGITPEDLNVRNVSLESRIALNKLRVLLEIPRKKGLFG